MNDQPVPSSYTVVVVDKALSIHDAQLAFHSLWNSARDLTAQLGYDRSTVKAMGGNRVRVPADVAELLEQRPPVEEVEEPAEVEEVATQEAPAEPVGEPAPAEPATQEPGDVQPALAAAEEAGQKAAADSSTAKASKATKSAAKAAEHKE